MVWLQQVQTQPDPPAAGAEMSQRILGIYWCPFPKRRCICEFMVFSGLNDHSSFACKDNSPMRQCSLFLSKERQVYDT